MRWIRFHLWIGDDGLWPWERKAMARRYEKGPGRPLSPEELQAFEDWRRGKATEA